MAHFPYRSRCANGVKSRVRNAPHQHCAGEEPLEEVKVPIIHMDYFAMSMEGREGVEGPSASDRRREDRVKVREGSGHQGPRGVRTDGLVD